MFPGRARGIDRERIKTELTWIQLQNLKGLEGNVVCQCGSEELIAQSAESARFRAAMLVLVFFDQFTYSHYRNVYDAFSTEFPIPKLRQHSFGGNASPSWFVYEEHGYDQKADWEITSGMFTKCAQHLRRWLLEKLERPVPELSGLIEREVVRTFKSHHHEYFKTDMGA